MINAAGTWAGAIADLAGVRLPILPRRGFVLVPEPLPLTIHHKVYDAGYVANVLSSDECLQTSAVVEGSDSGTVLIGSPGDLGKLIANETEKWAKVIRTANIKPI